MMEYEHLVDNVELSNQALHYNCTSYACITAENSIALCCAGFKGFCGARSCGDLGACLPIPDVIADIPLPGPASHGR